jgi:D-alanyl-D-alanine dipeptidase
LYSLETGLEVEMPSKVDEFSERAHVGYTGGSEVARVRRDLLRGAMEAEGFDVYENEWWHFDYKDWRKYRVMDVPL